MRVAIIDDPDQVAALAHPVRVAVLDALREPGSAAGVARALGETRQKVNYHVRALVDAGLIRPVGERRTGNFVEQLYRSVAGTFVVSPCLAWSDDRRAGALQAQLPLEHLVRWASASSATPSACSTGRPSTARRSRRPPWRPRSASRTPRPGPRSSTTTWRP